MAFNFPSNPTIGYVHAEAGKQYKWNGYSWVCVPVTDVYGPVFMTDSPPPNAVCGDMWMETDTGKLYVYYQDIDSKQWVEVGGCGSLDLDYLPLAGGKMSGQIDFNALTAINLANPINAQDAATKSYVDNHRPAIVSATIPTLDNNGNAVQQGDLWYDSVGGRTYMWYEDGNTNQWVDISPEPPFNALQDVAEHVATLTPANDDTAAQAAGVVVGQMYRIPGGTTWNDVRVRLV